MMRKIMTLGSKFDNDKPRMDLLAFESLEGLSKVLAFGAKKYGDNNWKLGINNSRLIASLLRHLGEIQRGNDIDEESGLPHIDCVGANWMFLSSNFKLRKHLDDRHNIVRADRPSQQSSERSGEKELDLTPEEEEVFKSVVSYFNGKPTKLMSLEDVMKSWTQNGADVMGKGWY